MGMRLQALPICACMGVRADLQRIGPLLGPKRRNMENEFLEFAMKRSMARANRLGVVGATNEEETGYAT